MENAITFEPAGLADPLPALLVASEVAELLHCAETTVNDMARRGTLPAVKPGVSWLFPHQALISHLNAEAQAQALERRRPTVPAGIYRTPKPVRPDLSKLML